MKLILLRHGTRDFGIGDVELNAVGRAEANALSLKNDLQQVQKIYVSPKARAQMTIGPLSEKLNIIPLEKKDLDQQISGESIMDFRKRIQNFLNKLTEEYSEKDGTFLICSHSDWLSMAVDLMDSGDLDSETIFFSCAQYYQFQWKEGLWIRS